MIKKIMIIFVLSIIGCSAWYLYKMPKQATIVVQVEDKTKQVEVKQEESKPQASQKQAESKPQQKTVIAAQATSTPNLQETQQQVDRNTIRLNEQEGKINELDNRVTTIESSTTTVVAQPVQEQPVSSQPVILPAYTEQELLNKLNITGLNKILNVVPRGICTTFSRVGKFETWGDSRLVFNGQEILTKQGAYHEDLSGWRDWVQVQGLATSTYYSYQFIYPEEGRQNTVIEKTFRTQPVEICE